MHEILKASVWPSAVTEVVPGTIYAVGGSVPAGVLSWYPSDAEGWLPIQGYVIRSGTDALLIDTGVSCHRREIRAGLAALLEGTLERRLTMTRREHDTIVNLPWIVDDFAIQSVCCSGELNVLDFFASMEESSVATHLAAASSARFQFIRADETLRVGDLSLQVLKTKFRTLAANWFYEPQSRTIFCSDSWGLFTQARAGGPFVIKPNPDQISANRIAHFLVRSRFDWLCGARPEPFIGEIQALTRDFRIDRVCPSFGGIIEGEAEVRELFVNTIEALKFLAQAEPISALEGFDLERLKPSKEKEQAAAI